THRPRSLWADAVCINQRDNKEKGHQVALMAKIYSNANCVLVWLGESNGAIHAGIGCFRRLADAAWKYGLRYNKKVDFDSSNAFFTQDWFAGLWIVQEYVLTSSVKIYSGPDVLSHQELSLAGSVFLLKLVRYHS
ncbi:HET-domain-containing protein, partial [Hyaloscypha bicolor E]